MFITGLTASMVVNALMTGMIVFRILKATGVKPTSVERTLGSTEGNKFQHLMFIIIESGMALFAIQLVRLVLFFISVPVEQLPLLEVGGDFVIVINQLLNVIIIRCLFYFFVLLMAFTWLGNCTNDNFGAGSNEVVLRWRRILQGNCRKSPF